MTTAEKFIADSLGAVQRLAELEELHGTRGAMRSLAICSGVVVNCDFRLNLLVAAGLALRFSEGPDGRMVVEAVRSA